MKFALIVPARLGSTRLPRKMLLNRTGQPLICHTAAAAAQACRAWPELFPLAVVATDSAEIRDAVDAFAAASGLPVRAEMTSPAHQSGSDRAAEVALRLPADVDGVINLQGDEPELEPEAIRGLAEMLRACPRADLATLGWPIRDAVGLANPNQVKIVVDARGFALYFSRAPIPCDRDGVLSAAPTTAAAASSDAGGILPATRERLERAGGAGLWHLGIYAFRRESLRRFVALPRGRLEQLENLEQLRALEAEMKILVGLAVKPPPKGIDTPEDYDEFVRRVAAGR